MKKIFKVEGMSCQHCVNAVKKGLLADQRINNVEVDLDSSNVSIEYEEDIKMEEIKSIIEKTGYSVID